MRPGVAKAATIALWLGAAVVLQGAKIKTQAQADPKFSFRQVKTWAWSSDGTGDVYMARSSEDDPAAVVKKRVDPVITAAVARELGLIGLNPATAGPPDITIHYYLLVTAGANAQIMGQFLPAVPLWGVPPFAAATQSLDIISRGSLVLDAISTMLSRVVWRGVAQTDLDFAPTDAARDAVIKDAAHELVKRIPMKK